MFSDLGWTRGDLALSISIGAVLAAILSPFVGSFVDRHGARWIMVISAFATGVCLILLGYVYELWQAFLIFSLLAVFRVGFISIPVMTMVSNWFSEKRGIAMGIMTAGQGLGGFVFSPLSIYLISSIGWRLAWGVIGLITWVIMIPSVLLVVKNNSESKGLRADTKAPKGESITLTVKDNIGTPLKSDKGIFVTLLRMPTFWFVALFHFLYLFGHASIFQQGFSLFIDKGIPAMTAGTMVGILGLFSLSGKVVLGYLSDRISLRYVMIAALVLAAIFISPLLFTASTWGAWLFIILWGFWECGIIALQPVLVATLFDKAIIGKMLGIFSIFSVFAQLIGPPFMGYVHDITGDYNLALSTFIICYVISGLLIFLIRPTHMLLRPQ